MENRRLHEGLFRHVVGPLGVPLTADASYGRNVHSADDATMKKTTCQADCMGDLALKAEVFPRRRLPASERRQQIIEAVYRVVSEHGIQGATIARVAASAGVGIGTVYRSFDDQKAMLRSAIETMSEEMVRSIPDSYNENALEHIRQMADRHEALVSANGGHVARLWHQFVGASETLGLHETMVLGRRKAARAIREVCERGQAQGSIREDVDLDLLAYRILEQGWGAEMSLLVGHDDFLGRNCASRVLEDLLESIAVETTTREPLEGTGETTGHPR